MEPITQDKRVSQGHNGDLYFSNVMVQDMQTDYSCNARFHFTHTIQQKNPFTLKVLTSKCRPCWGSGGQGGSPSSQAALGAWAWGRRVPEADLETFPANCA